ncbi:hypothetical protein [Alicyclobacillus dauci]|uniref:Transposase n=1 Tax=Alicyclobacillus dauci TaxID=1475485 RepID=A0ABY6YX38_9BACL|nr:hypothetical protein [Alicyclobacillus dauci]WAH35072.1 hypothetical protein NZD86_12110 [Alicyclobacillus dauci]
MWPRLILHITNKFVRINPADPMTQSNLHDVVQLISALLGG